MICYQISDRRIRLLAKMNTAVKHLFEDMDGDSVLTAGQAKKVKLLKVLAYIFFHSLKGHTIQPTASSQ